jgi:DNA-binding CsgD family transcriptional regulator
MLQADDVGETRMLAGESHANDLLDVLYAAAGDPAVWTQFLGQVSRDMDAPWTGLISVDPSSQKHCVYLKFGIPSDAACLYEERHAAHDPWFQAYRRQNLCGYVGTGTSLGSPSEFEKTEFYSDFFRLYNSAHECGMIIEHDGGGVMALTALRRTAQPDFDRQHVALLAELGPHLTRALRLHGKMLDLKLAASTAAHILDTLDTALVGLDAEGSICFSNAIADSILLTERVLCVQNGKLVARNPAQTSSLERLWKTTVKRGMGMPASSSMRLHSGEHSLHLTMFPYHGGNDQFPGSMKMFVTLADPAAPPKSRVRLLEDLFGLTPTEARVTMLLVAGMESWEIAKHTRTTQNTVRFNLKVIYRKTGVNRQSQLVRLVSTLPGQT